MAAEQSAHEYGAELARCYGSDALQAGRPLFDVCLLGLGTDGHVASLFPNSPALADTVRWVLPTVREPAETGISLTLPALNSSALTMFLVSSNHKAGILRRLAEGADLPAQHIRPQGGGRSGWWIARCGMASSR